MNLKKAISENKVKEYMSTIKLSDFIKEYDSLDTDEMKSFVTAVNEYNSKDWKSFNSNSENIPPYHKF